MKLTHRFLVLCVLLIATDFRSAKAATRLKELASIEGIRDNQLVGYGIVVGLNGTGDKRQTVFSAQSLANILQQMGVSVPSAAIRVNNTAAVMVTATLPPFGQPGMKIDVTAAAIGDATNLQGGLLILTSLKGVDGQVYALAQGPVVTGGFSAGKSLSTQTVNHPTVGRVPAGASVERVSPSVTPTGKIRLQLRQPDFSTAFRVSQAVNKKFPGVGGELAKAENSAVVSIRIPAEYNARTTEFVAEIEHLTVDADRVARVVINERTGTIVMGKEVHVSPVAIMHGNLTVEVQTTLNVSQPGPLSKKGETIVTPDEGTKVKQEPARNLVLENGATVEQLVRMLGSIGTSPRDVIAILQNLRAAGALEADIEVI